MMRGTPRTFVGTVVLLLREPARENGAAVVAEEVARIPGVGSVELDDAGTLVVSATAPVDRSDLLALLERLGCSVLA
ncbi:MAG: hypothetical protein H6529_15215 [Nocardioides sp.]|nr:hypothetical protein [Nocardioidaceae bacterium]MCB8957814.1 hypothetical protein [Nocardioides sp.]